MKQTNNSKTNKISNQYIIVSVYITGGDAIMQLL